MSHDTTRVSLRLVAWMTLLAVALTSPGALAAGGPYTFEVAFQQAPVSPEILTQPVAVLSLRAKVGDPDDGMRKVTVTLTAANGSDEDHDLRIELTLLDESGAGLATRTLEEEVDEGEIAEFSLKIRLPEETVGRIARCRVSYDGSSS